MAGPPQNFDPKTPTLCLQMQGFHPIEILVNLCQSIEVFFVTDNFILKPHYCST